jgi:hypothetical protein
MNELQNVIINVIGDGEEDGSAKQNNDGNNALEEDGITTEEGGK